VLYSYLTSLRARLRTKHGGSGVTVLSSAHLLRGQAARPRPAEESALVAVLRARAVLQTDSLSEGIEVHGQPLTCRSWCVYSGTPFLTRLDSSTDAGFPIYFSAAQQQQQQLTQQQQ